MGGGSSPAHVGGISGGPAKGGLGGEPAAAGGNSQTGAASNALSYGSLKNRFVAAPVIANQLLMYLVRKQISFGIEIKIVENIFFEQIVHLRLKILVCFIKTFCHLNHFCFS